MEQYASRVRPRSRLDGPQRLIQILVCAGALVAAGAVTIEARISAAPAPSALKLTPIVENPIITRVESNSPPAVGDALDAKARAAAQRALAQKLAKADALGKEPEPAVAPEAGSGATPPTLVSSTTARAAPAPQAKPAADVPAAAPSTNALSEAGLRLLALKAAQALKAGDIGGARMVLERAASAGDATALFALGETYDPEVLAKMRVRGLRGDRAKAVALYQRAADAGVAEAKQRLERITDGNTASAD